MIYLWVTLFQVDLLVDSLWLSWYSLWKSWSLPNFWVWFQVPGIGAQCKLWFKIMCPLLPNFFCFFTAGSGLQKKDAVFHLSTELPDPPPPGSTSGGRILDSSPSDSRGLAGARLCHGKMLEVYSRFSIGGLDFWIHEERRLFEHRWDRDSRDDCGIDGGKYHPWPPRGSPDFVRRFSR